MNAKQLAPLSLLSTLLIAAPAFGFDADSDGTKDAADAYPCEANAVGAGFYPAQGDHGLMMFEDLWPSNGDRDYNDAVIAYNYIYKFDANGDVIQIRATFNVLALGAEIRSGLGLSLPIPRTAVGGVRLTRWDKHKSEESSINLVPTNDANLTFTITNDMREFFDWYGGGINTSASEPRLEGETIEIWIDMWQPTPFPTAEAPYDLYIFRTATPSHEVHRPEYSGTGNMNTALFNTVDDGSSPTRSFVNVGGLPFALVFPTLVPYPSEGVRIDTLYPNITAWAASGGTTNQDFYTNGVNIAAAYSDVNGLGAPTPEFIGPADLPAQTGCIRDWGLAVEWGSVASRYSYGAVVDPSGLATLTGYTQGAFMNQTNAGGLDAFVARYDTTSGNLIWVQQLGSSGDDAGRDIVSDSSGNLYVVGTERREIGGYPTETEETATYDVVGDVILHFDREGNRLDRWTVFDWFDPTDVPEDLDDVYWESFNDPFWDFLYGGGTKDWSHVNNVHTDPRNDNHLILSVRHLDVIAKVDLEANTLLWSLGPHSDDFTMVGDGEWQYHQHAPQMQDDGSILVYDNGNGRNGEENGADSYTRVVHYAVDEDDMEVEQLWEYRGEEQYFARFVGDVDFVDNGNVLITDGGILSDPTIPETSPDGGRFGRLVEVTYEDDPRVVLEVVIGDDSQDEGYNLFRSTRFDSFYPAPSE